MSLKVSGVSSKKRVSIVLVFIDTKQVHIIIRTNQTKLEILNSIRYLNTQVQKKKLPNPSKPGLIGTKHSHIDMLTASIYFSADTRNYAVIKTIILWKGWQVSDWSLSFSLTGWFTCIIFIHSLPCERVDICIGNWNRIDFLLTHSNRRVEKLTTRMKLR